MKPVNFASRETANIKILFWSFLSNYQLQEPFHKLSRNQGHPVGISHKSEKKENTLHTNSESPRQAQCPTRRRRACILSINISINNNVQRKLKFVTHPKKGTESHGQVTDNEGAPEDHQSTGRAIGHRRKGRFQNGVKKQI